METQEFLRMVDTHIPTLGHYDRRNKRKLTKEKMEIPTCMQTGQVSKGLYLVAAADADDDDDNKKGKHSTKCKM
jgi:hypothetical protein